jgi:tagatose 1,6-diphosphate aldolase
MAKKTALEITSMTPGKLLGMQRITNPNGTLTLLALDHNSAILKLAKAALERIGEKREPTYDEIVAGKLNLTQILGKKAGAILLDTAYGAWHAVCAFRCPMPAGLILRLERSGAATTPDGVGRTTGIEEGWSVAKSKRLGANAVKLRVPYDPSHVESVERQRTLVEQVARACDEHDILFLLETLSYPLAGETSDSASYIERKPTTVIDTARHLSGLCDVYAAELPGTLGRESDAQLAANLDALNAASVRPWVLLSAGADFTDYEKQVRMAVEHGASGVLGGRAFWKEYYSYDKEAERVNFLRTEGLRRLSVVADIVKKHAQPWFKKYRLSKGSFARCKVPEGWHRNYAGRATLAQAPFGPSDTSGPY